MKKLTTALCAVLLMILVLMPGAAAAGPALSATRAYCIIDADTGLVLAQQNMNEELHPASITKVMTLALACEKAQGSWDGVKLTVSHEDVHSLAGTDSSHIALQEGEEVPLTDALYATQMASANDGANLLVAADCTAYAYANFHAQFMRSHVTLIGCPKLDDGDYTEKLTAIIRDNNIKSVCIVRMEVPCCGGLEQAVKNALQASGKFLPWQVVTISIDGHILD